LIGRASYERWSHWLILLFLVLLPFQPQQIQFNSILLILLLALSLLKFPSKEEGRNLLKLIWLPLLFLLLGVSLLWSQDFTRGQNSLFKILPFLLIPFVFSFQKGEKLNQWKWAYVFACLVSSILGMGNGILKFMDSGLSQHLAYQYVSVFIPPAYTSLYVGVAIALLIGEIRKTAASVWIHMGIWLFMLHLAFIFSRSGILLLAILLVFYISNIWRQRIYLISLLIALLISGFALSQNKKVIDRVNGTIKVLQGGFTLEKAKTSAGARMWIWNSALEALADEPLIGHGLGSDRKVLMEIYQEKELSFGLERTYNAHNQYLQYALAGGVIALGLFVFLFIHLSWTSWKMGNVTGSVVVLLMAVAFFTESMLERQAGIFLFSFFYCFIAWQNRFAPEKSST
jgi:O-antigen ligase